MSNLKCQTFCATRMTAGGTAACATPTLGAVMKTLIIFNREPYDSTDLTSSPP